MSTSSFGPPPFCQAATRLVAIAVGAALATGAGSGLAFADDVYRAFAQPKERGPGGQAQSIVVEDNPDTPENEYERIVFDRPHSLLPDSAIAKMLAADDAKLKCKSQLAICYQAKTPEKPSSMASTLRWSGVVAAAAALFFIVGRETK